MKSLLSELHCVTEKQLTNIKTPKTFGECEKKIIKIANFIYKNFKDYGHSFNFREKYFEQTNIFKLINVYGYGNCINSSMLFSFLMDLLKIKNEMLFMKYKKNSFSHVINIIYINKKIYVLDVGYGIFEYNKKLIQYEKLKQIVIKSKILEKNFKEKYLDHLYLYSNKKKLYINQKILKNLI